MPKYAETNMRIICKYMQKYAEGNMHKYAQICNRNMHNTCNYMQKYAAENMQYYTRICIFSNVQIYAIFQFMCIICNYMQSKIMPKYAFKNIQNFATVCLPMMAS